MRVEFVRTCLVSQVQPGESFYHDTNPFGMSEFDGVVTVLSLQNWEADETGFRLFTDTHMQVKHERRGRISLCVPETTEVSVLRILRDQDDLSPSQEEERAPAFDGDTLEPAPVEPVTPAEPEPAPVRRGLKIRKPSAA